MKRKKTAKASESPSFANPEIGQIEQLLRFMAEHNLEEFEYSRGDLRIRLKKPSSGSVVTTTRAMSAPEIIVAGPGTNPPGSAVSLTSSAAPVMESRQTDDMHLVKSPIVGTFYA